MNKTFPSHDAESFGVEAELQKAKDAACNGDYETAVKTWIRLAEMGNKESMKKLGNYYLYPGTNYLESINWYKKAIELDPGDTEAMRELGSIYSLDCDFEGNENPEFNPSAAERWYIKAIELGDTQALHELGLFYHLTLKDDEEAVWWYRRGADLGRADCMGELGVCYIYGFGVKQDLEEALVWLIKSKENETEDDYYDMTDDELEHTIFLLQDTSSI